MEGFIPERRQDSAEVNFSRAGLDIGRRVRVIRRDRLSGVVGREVAVGGDVVGRTREDI